MRTDVDGLALLAGLAVDVDLALHGRAGVDGGLPAFRRKSSLAGSTKIFDRSVKSFSTATGLYQDGMNDVHLHSALDFWFSSHHSSVARSTKTCNVHTAIASPTNVARVVRVS